VFTLQEKNYNKHAGNWFQLLTVLFTNIRSLFPTYNFRIMIVPARSVWFQMNPCRSPGHSPGVRLESVHIRAILAVERTGIPPHHWLDLSQITDLYPQINHLSRSARVECHLAV
jgi:hypothetical protein